MPLTNVTAIANGDSFACALIAGGTVECWGLDFSGDLVSCVYGRHCARVSAAPRGGHERSVAGAVFGLVASGAWNNSKNECSALSCSSRGQALSDHDKAVTYGTVSTLGFIAGGARVAGAAVLFLTAPSTNPEKQTAARFYVWPSIGPTEAGVSVSRSF
jgi:hypothetical protein